MAENDIKEEYFHVDSTSCQLIPLIALAGDVIYEQFIVDQETPLDIWVTYVRFIERLRLRLGVGTRRTHGLPVLSPPQLTDEPSSIKWMNLRLRANKRHLNLFIRQDNLTLIGFQRQDSNNEVLELGYTGNPHIIDGSTFIEVTHYYPDLLQKAELDSVRDIKLGQPQLIRAISELNRATALKIRAYHLIVIMQMICESIKFSRISDHLATIFGPPGSGSGSGPPLWMDHLTHSWENLSAALQRADAHPDHRLPSNKMGFKSIAEAINAFGIVKYYSFNHHHPLSVLGGKGNYYDGKSLFGQPKVEVFEVRINNINGENPAGNLYGTVIIRDGLISQYLYNRMRDHEEIIHPGDSAILIGPTQSISAYDSFTIDVDLKDKDMKKSFDNEVSKGHVLWNVHDANNEYDVPLSKRIDGRHGSVTVNYIVLGDAVEATVEVRLLFNADDQDPANVYGLLTAKNSKSLTETVLFRKPSNEFVKVSPRNEAIPLSRSVVAIPSGAYLIVTANLKHSDHQIAEGTATFSTQLSGSDEKHVKGLHGDVIVKVTWTS